MGCVHIDTAELRLAQCKLNMFLAIDRVSKFTYVEFRDDMGKMNGADFLRGVINAFPHKIHTFLTDNGMAFADLPKNRNKPIHAFFGMHIFGRVCRENGIVHKLTKPYHPWTNGQAERMNRTIKAFHHLDLQSLQAHVLAFVYAFNIAKHLKALRWKTPHQTLVDAWQKNPATFKTDPRHLIPGPYTQHDMPVTKASHKPMTDIEADFMNSQRSGAGKRSELVTVRGFGVILQ
jgi:IS30 family transposase